MACALVAVALPLAFLRGTRPLLALLRLNAREPVASLARKLSLSRTAVQDRLRKLEGSGAIAGYAVKLGKEGKSNGISAMITLGVEPKRQIEQLEIAVGEEHEDAARLQHVHRQTVQAVIGI